MDYIKGRILYGKSGEKRHAIGIIKNFGENGCIELEPGRHFVVAKADGSYDIESPEHYTRRTTVASDWVKERKIPKPQFETHTERGSFLQWQDGSYVLFSEAHDGEYKVHGIVQGQEIFEMSTQFHPV